MFLPSQLPSKFISLNSPSKIEGVPKGRGSMKN